MLKNKFKIISILTLIILALTLPIVRAENETPEEVTSPPTEEVNEKAPDGVTNPEVDPEASESNNMNDDNFKKHDVYLTGDTVTVDYIVDGNLFIFANNVTINSQIGGDAFIFANTVTVGEQGYVFSNLFTFSKAVNIKGVVYDLYAAAENTTITGYVYRDIRVGSNTVNIFGTVGRNAFVGCNNLNFVKNAEENTEEASSTGTLQGTINGNLNYSAPNESSIPEGAVTGETNFKPENAFDENVVAEKIMDLGTFVITIIAVWLVCLWLAPKFLKNTTTLLPKKLLPVVGLGILTPIVAILATILFFVLGITAPLGLLLILISIILMAISTAIFIITLNQMICEKLKIEKKIGIFGMLVVCSIVLWLIGLIPYVGSILGIIVVILGLGIITSSLIFRKKEIVD